MHNLVIIAYKNTVVYNTISLSNLENLPIPSNVKQLYWDEQKSSGWIENLDNNGDWIGNDEITELPVWASDCLVIFQNTWNAYEAKLQRTPLEQCKYNAKGMLQSTDWVEIPSVTDPSNVPYLLNANEFLAFRAAARNLVINPVENPVYPIEPKAQWSR